MNEHLFIPDTQCKPNCETKHLTAVGNYIVDKKPNVIIHAGDHWDMQSLSSYDKGTKKAEGSRYTEDIEAGLLGMEALLGPVTEYNNQRKKNKLKLYKPRFIFLIGNHEERIMRHVNANPNLSGAIGYHDFQLDSLGWEVYNFLEPVTVDGITYAHYFYNPMTGKPWSGKAHTRLKNIGFSFTQGHQQGKDIAEYYLANGQIIRGLIAGSYYMHDEDYKGPQANHHWRGLIYKHEVHDGDYCLMELSLNYMLKEWI